MKTRGFTLVEVLVALSLFAVGMLGTGLFLARGLHAAADTGMHSAAQSALQSEAERLRRTARQGPQALRRALIALTRPHRPPFAEGNPLLQSVRLRLLEARDDRGRDLLAGSGPATPPYHIVLEVSYRDARLASTLQRGLILTPPPGSAP